MKKELRIKALKSLSKSDLIDYVMELEDSKNTYNYMIGGTTYTPLNVLKYDTTIT